VEAPPMSGKLTRIAYRQLIAEDIQWLESHPRTLERDHIISIVRESERYYYEDAQDEVVREAREQALRPLSKDEEMRITLALDEHSKFFAVERVNRMLVKRKAHP
jgi:hypothetical protein